MNNEIFTRPEYTTKGTGSPDGVSPSPQRYANGKLTAPPQPLSLAPDSHKWMQPSASITLSTPLQRSYLDDEDLARASRLDPVTVSAWKAEKSALNHRIEQKDEWIRVLSASNDRLITWLMLSAILGFAGTLLGIVLW